MKTVCAYCRAPIDVSVFQERVCDPCMALHSVASTPATSSDEDDWIEVDEDDDTWDEEVDDDETEDPGWDDEDDEDEDSEHVYVVVKKKKVRR